MGRIKLLLILSIFLFIGCSDEEGKKAEEFQYSWKASLIVNEKIRLEPFESPRLIIVGEVHNKYDYDSSLNLKNGKFYLRISDQNLKLGFIDFDNKTVIKKGEKKEFLIMTHFIRELEPYKEAIKGGELIYVPNETRPEEKLVVLKSINYKQYKEGVNNPYYTWGEDYEF